MPSGINATGNHGWRQNLTPSLVVFLISVPLSMGIAIASGVPAARGLVTAIVGGLVVGGLTGTRLQVSGPSAGMAVMVLDLVNRHGLTSLGVVLPLMGILQMTAGRLKLGQIFRAVAPAVIDGMLAGIGVLILAAQCHVMVDDSPKGSGLSNLLSIPEAVFKGLSSSNDTVHHLAAQIGVLTLLLLVAMKPLSRMVPPLRHLPPPLVAVGVATLMVWLVGLPISKVTMPDSFLATVSPPDRQILALLAEPTIWGTTFAFAFVASAETLLCATAVDAMHDGSRTDYDRELFAQGVGNFACGLLGAPPLSGVITRSTANAQAGATAPSSAVMVGGWMLAVLVLFPTALQVVPRASLAGLLVYVGYKLIKTRPLQRLRWYGRSELLIFATTLGVIVAVNLLNGIVVGLALAAGKLLYSRGRSFHRLDIVRQDEPDMARSHLHLSGAASFLRLPRLASALEKLPLEQEVLLHVEELEYIDHACLDLLEKWEASRIRAHAPVRVLWNHLRHQYHAGNRLDSTPFEHRSRPDSDIYLMEFLSPQCFLINPDLKSFEHALEVLSKRLAQVDPSVDSHQHIFETALQRENEGSTYLGDGLMIPHARLEHSGKLHGALALSKQGWQFGATGNETIHCILLLQTPENQATLHLAIVACFSRVFASVPQLRSALLNAKTPDEAHDILIGPEASSVNTVVARRVSESAELKRRHAR